MKYKDIRDLFFPPVCPVCDQFLSLDRMEKGICGFCRKKDLFIKGNICMTCGKRIRKADEYCSDCMKMKHSFEHNRALFVYGRDIKKMMYRFKYSNRRSYADFFADEALRRWGRYLQGNFDAVIPIPMNEEKMKKRGYNQAEVFGRELARRLGIPLVNALSRQKTTEAMKRLDPAERRLNLINAFKYSETGVKLGKVLVVDDIYTTGATLDSASDTLKDNGVKRVYAFCISIGDDHG